MSHQGTNRNVWLSQPCPGDGGQWQGEPAAPEAAVGGQEPALPRAPSRVLVEDGAGPASLMAFLLLFFALLSPHVLLQAAVDDLELALDARRTAHPGSYTLLSHQVGDLPLLLGQPSLLVDAARESQNH